MIQSCFNCAMWPCLCGESAPRIPPAFDYDEGFDGTPLPHLRFQRSLNSIEGDRQRLPAFAHVCPFHASEINQ